MKTIRVELERRSKKNCIFQPAVVYLPAETENKDIKKECKKHLESQGLRVYELSIKKIER